MAGEIAVFFNIPQPFTVRTRRLSQVIRLSHHHFKQILQPHSEDGKILISNFVEVSNFILYYIPSLLLAFKFKEN